MADESELGFETAMRRLSLGGGLYYHQERGQRGATLPVQAGVDYRAAFSGSGGLTPMSSSVNFYLRLFFRLLGSRGAPAAEPGGAPDR